ncbi:MAG: thiamine diphosphokinase [Christensenellales bacterium]
MRGRRVRLSSRQDRPDRDSGRLRQRVGARLSDRQRSFNFSAEKDFTEGHLAIACAIERGADEIDVYGAFGGARPDHAYANLSLLYLGKKRGAFVRLISRKWLAILRSERFTQKTKPGGYFSLVPFFESSHILSTKGLKYSACDVTLYREQSLGISNEAKGDVVEVDLSGETLVFIEVRI